MLKAIEVALSSGKTR